MTHDQLLRHIGTGEDLGWSLGTLLRAYRERLAPILGAVPHGPRGYQTLLTVMRGDHPSQLALATYLGLDRTVMTYLIDDLEGAGLVERRPNPVDRRQRQIIATDLCRETLASLCRQVTAAEDAVLAALDPDERAVLRKLLGDAACAVADPTTDPCDALDD